MVPWRHLLYRIIAPIVCAVSLVVYLLKHFHKTRRLFHFNALFLGRLANLLVTRRPILLLAVPGAIVGELAARTLENLAFQRVGAEATSNFALVVSPVAWTVRNGCIVVPIRYGGWSVGIEFGLEEGKEFLHRLASIGIDELSHHIALQVTKKVSFLRWYKAIVVTQLLDLFLLFAFASL